MDNLAGKQDCDTTIRSELERCGITIVEGERSTNEVPASLTGILGCFTFWRAWYYWVVNGNVPIDIALELYADPVGKTDVRVDGHCGCPEPEYLGKRGAVTCYHIDTEIGLRLFADTIRKHGMDKGQGMSPNNPRDRPMEPVARKWYSLGLDGEFEEHDTPEKAEHSAEKWLQLACDEDHWPEDVNSIEWGELICHSCVVKTGWTHIAEYELQDAVVPSVIPGHCRDCRFRARFGRLCTSGSYLTDIPPDGSGLCWRFERKA